MGWSLQKFVKQNMSKWVETEWGDGRSFCKYEYRMANGHLYYNILTSSQGNDQVLPKLRFLFWGFDRNQLSQDNQSDQMNGFLLCDILLQLLCNSLLHNSLVCPSFLRNSLLRNSFSATVCYTIVANLTLLPILRFWPQPVSTQQSIKEAECCGGRRAISNAIVCRNILLCNSLISDSLLWYFAMR